LRSEIASRSRSGSPGWRSANAARASRSVKEEDVVRVIDDATASQSTADLEQGEAGQAERHADREELVLLVHRMSRLRPL
jgi:hypothetical protein